MADQIEDDPSAYLTTEAKIIAEDEAHVTIALRLDKTTITRNLRGATLERRPVRHACVGCYCLTSKQPTVDRR
jgi:hypothetical protein